MRGKLLGVAVVTFGFLTIALRGADLDAIGDAWSGLQVWRIAAAVGLHFVVLVVRTERFRHLVPNRPAFGPLLAVMGASFLAINVIPLRMGELVRPYLLSQRGIPIADAALAVVIERFLDLVALLVLVLVATTWIDATGWQGRTTTVFGTDVVVLGRGAVGASVLLVLVLLVASRAVARSARGEVDGTPGRWRVALRQLDRAFDALAQRSAMDVLISVLCTIASWAGAIAVCALTMGGFPTLEPSLATVLVDWGATVSAVVLVPTPGFMGAFEAGAVGALVLLGRDADVARAFALALHAIQLGSTLLAGAIGFGVLGVSLPTVVRASRAR